MNQATIEELVKEEFFFFILERWLISSGEHLGERFSFRERPYMQGICEDEFPNQVILKSAQCGISEIMVARACDRAVHKGRNVLYTMPAGEQMAQFVDSRARNAVLNNPYLSQYVTGSLNLKKFSLKNRQIYFRGVQNRRQIISVDVSSLFTDELDEYEEGTLYTLTKRLGAAASPEKFMFSTPSFHSTGVSLLYYGSTDAGERGSDRRVWTIRCDSCGKPNEDLLWDENVVDLNEADRKLESYKPNVIIICRHCKKPMDRLSANGEWVAEFPSNSEYLHGYHISKLFAPGTNLNALWLDSKDPVKEMEFFNSDLGLPYEPKGSRITDQMLDGARGNHLLQMSGKTLSFAGVDVGKHLHVTVSRRDEENRLRLIGAFELDSWEELDQVSRKFDLGCTVIDMNPDKDEAMKYQQAHDNVWLAYYAQHLENTVEKYTVNWDDQVIAVNRTLMMMTVSDMIANGHLLLPLDIRQVKGFYAHMKSPIKAQKQTVQGDWVTFYPKTKAPDHFYHSALYKILATSLASRPAVLRIANTHLR